MTRLAARDWLRGGTGVPVAGADPLRRVRRAGYAVLALQLAAFGWWSTVLYQRFALTFDFAVYHQPWYLIAHGQLDPYSSVARVPGVPRLHFWQNDGEFAIWPLAPLYWLGPHDLVLLWVQDICVAVAEAVAFGWLCDLARRHLPSRGAGWLAGAGLVLLVANPWIWWAVSFDYHEEAVALPFAVLLARDLAGGRRRMWAWVAPILAAGAPSATYVVGIGLGGLLAGGRSRLTGAGPAGWRSRLTGGTVSGWRSRGSGAGLAGRRTRAAGAVLALVGIGYSVLLVLIHADVGVPLVRHYGYLVAHGAGGPGAAGGRLTTGGLVWGVISHPQALLRTLWAKHADTLANLAPAGLLGIAWPAVLPLVLVVLLANDLSSGMRFAEPLFQALPVYVFIPVGTVAVLGWLARRHRRAALAVTGLVVAQAVGWAAVWGPRTAGQWLRVPPAAAATLARVQSRIPGAAEVMVSQGVIGRFSGRQDIHELAGPATVPVSGAEMWFVIAPAVGTEMETTGSAMALIGLLAGPLHATLVTAANGVWVLRWRPPAGVRSFTIPGDSASLPAWAGAGAAGRAVLTGPPGNWHVTATGRPGYVADGLAWQEPPGRYEASVRLSASGPVNVEVWNDTGDVLLARRSVPGTAGAQTVSMPVGATARYQAGVYSGWGPFRATFVAPPPGQRLEVRVWSPGGGTVNVYGARLIRSCPGQCH